MRIWRRYSYMYDKMPIHTVEGGFHVWQIFWATHSFLFFKLTHTGAFKHTHVYTQLIVMAITGSGNRNEKEGGNDNDDQITLLDFFLVLFKFILSTNVLL